MAELHRQRADAAGGRVHDDRLAGRQLGARPIQVPGGEALQQDGQRGGVVDPFGDRERHRLGRDGVLRVAAVADQRDDALAGVLAHAGDLGAGHERQLRLGQVGVLALVGVGEVQTGARDPDEDLAVPRRRHREVDELEHVGAAELLLLDGSHPGDPNQAAPTAPRPLISRAL